MGIPDGGVKAVASRLCLHLIEVYERRFGANVGRAASGAARGAARFVSTPLRVAQRNYAVVGRQAFLTSAGVLQADGGKFTKSISNL